MTARVTVVGLGPGGPLLRTVGSQRALDRADRIVLRTRIHPALDDLAADPRATDCDDLYEAGATFEDVYDEVTARVLVEATARDDGEVVFAVPGHPRFGERAVRLLIERATAAGVPIEVQSASSALDAIAVALGVDPFGDEVQIRDGLELVASVERDPFAGGLVAIDPARPCLVGQVYAPAVAAGAKLALSRLYPEDHPIVVIRAAGVPGQERQLCCRLFELDRQPVDHLTSVWLPALPALEADRSPHALQRIVALLRAPGGCPWDRKQTHGSLRAAVVEEAYEVVDAIDAGDDANLAEELGDLLLQVFLHAQIAEEDGSFLLEDVFQGASAKLLRRHPHVFGDVGAETTDDVVATWEAVKAAERARSGKAAKPEHPLDRLPRSMPALTRAATLLAPRKGSAPPSMDAERERVAGEALLTAVEASVASGVDPERAIAAALRRRVDDEAKTPDQQAETEGRATA